MKTSLGQTLLFSAGAICLNRVVYKRQTMDSGKVRTKLEGNVHNAHVTPG